MKKKSLIFLSITYFNVVLFSFMIQAQQTPNVAGLINEEISYLDFMPNSAIHGQPEIINLNTETLQPNPAKNQITVNYTDYNSGSQLSTHLFDLNDISSDLPTFLNGNTFQINTKSLSS